MAVTQKFSNSDLISYTKLSPNHSGLRKMNIDTISIHHMGGNLSIESCGNVFANKERKASSNYGIGSDGRIALYVEEKNRSWCTSSADVDNRAVTIEVANIENKEPWKVSDKAYESLIKLCADICRRNNIKELKWKNDKSLLFKTEEQNMIPHCYIKATQCPGTYLLNHYGDIANKVNSLLNNKETNIVSNNNNDSNEKKIWNYLKDKKFSDYAIAGIMGNLFAESGLIPNNLQNTFNKSLNMTDEEYTQKVDDGSYKNFINDKAGYGLAQWTYHTRKQKLLEFAQSRNVSISDLYMQLDFLLEEMKGYPYLDKILVSSNDIKECSDAFLTNFERPADMSDKVKDLRFSYAEKIYKNNVTSSNTSLPYKVKVTDNSLNIRKGPGTNFDIVGKITDNGIYTITEEANGKGATKWLKLKSGLGYISADYCKKINC